MQLDAIVNNICMKVTHFNKFANIENEDIAITSFVSQQISPGQRNMRNFSFLHW